MSDPREQRADGCSMFFTLLTVVFVSVCIFFIHDFLQPDNPEETSSMLDRQRLSKINDFKSSNDEFNQKIVGYHVDGNSSLEHFMKKTVSDYQVVAKEAK